MKALIVEDDKVHAERIARALDDMGMEHFRAESAEEARQMPQWASAPRACW